MQRCVNVPRATVCTIGDPDRHFMEERNKYTATLHGIEFRKEIRAPKKREETP